MTDVQTFQMSIVSEWMSYEDVLMTVGEKIATFCRQYTTKFMVSTPAEASGTFILECNTECLHICGHYKLYSTPLKHKSKPL